jgi:hypothetical protein
LFVIGKPTSPQPARRDDAALAAFLAGLARMRDGAIDAAKALVAVEQAGHFVFEGCASIGEFGERHGASAWETRYLLGLGRAMAASPGVEERFREGRVPLPSASLLGLVLADASLARPGDDWVGWAETESERTFRRRVNRRVEEVRLGEQAAVALTFFVSKKGRDDFARARAIASRKADRLLTDGETLERVVDHFLATFDPRRRREASRRLPHTAGVRGRYVPAQVQREVAARDDDRCAVPFCDHDIFLQNAHVVPHAEGGDREARNLLRLCSRHHRMFDLGQLRLLGSPEQPVFVDAAGRRLDGRAPDGPPRATGPPPEGG